MTGPGQPQPYPGDLVAALPGTVRYRRVYLDALGRPMSGSLTFTGTARTEAGGAVVLPAPVVVPVGGNGGVDVWLPSDTYTVEASLRTADGARVTDSDTVTLTP